MARIDSLSILTSSGTGHDYLAEQYGKVVENVQNGVISNQFKNQELSGDITAGTVEAKRFANASIDAYGTARAGGAGKKIKAGTVTVPIDTDRELVEEVEDKDTRLYGVEGLVERRLANMTRRVIKFLEKEFWEEANTGGTVYNPTPAQDTIKKKINGMIVELENTHNDYVDGVSRDIMALVLSPQAYSDLQDEITNMVQPISNNEVVNFEVYRKVKVYSSTDLYQGTDAVLLCEGAIAQPYYFTEDEPGKIPMSDAYHFGLFLHTGVKTVASELVKVLKQTVATPAADPVAGTYTGTQTVELSCATEDADIYYTLDGTTPTKSSTKYTEEISIAETKTIKAKAFKSGFNDSALFTAAYTIS